MQRLSSAVQENANLRSYRRRTGDRALLAAGWAGSVRSASQRISKSSESYALCLFDLIYFTSRIYLCLTTMADPHSEDFWVQNIEVV
jgi:hypothetical protein